MVNSTKRSIPELLVPAGGPEQLKAAVANGADAVYMSGRSFNARISAENFSDEAMKRAIEFAHTYGVDAHIAMNTLLRDEEIDRAVDFACRMYEAGADALIVQDPGLIMRLRGECPDLTLHMSTQGSVYDAQGAVAAQAMGMKRVITARELSLEEIREICRAVDIEVEVFVHGAICIGYSGQCHLSGTIGGRSGNRGECAQPCRLPYELTDSNGKTAVRGYLLSPHDMSLLDHLSELADAGVASLKIEGRLKSPEYVAMTTSVYRRHLDRIREGNDPVSRSEFAADTAGLRQVFSRGPFTDAYLRGISGSELMAAETPKHTGIRIGELIRTDRKRGHAQIRLTAQLQNGDGVEIRDGDRSCGNVITYIRGKNGKLIRWAEPGMAVSIGDLDRDRLGGLREGAPVFRITDSNLMKELQRSYEKIPPRVPVDLHLLAVTGAPAVLTAATEQGGLRRAVSVESGAPLEWAESRPLQEDRARKSLEKTGGTPYILRKLEMVIEGDPFLPASELNAMRRQALEQLTAERTAVRPAVQDVTENSGERNKTGEQQLRKDFSDLDSTVPEGKETDHSGINVGKETEVPPESSAKETVVLYFYNAAGAEQRIMSLADEAVLKDPAVEFAVPYHLLLSEFSAKTENRLQESAAKKKTRLQESAVLSESAASQPSASAAQQTALQPSELVVRLRDAGVRVYAVMPAVTRTLDEQMLEGIFESLEKMYENRMIDGVYAANLSHIHFLSERTVPFIADVSMNILNRKSVHAMKILGASGAVLSYEPDALENGRSFLSDNEPADLRPEDRKLSRPGGNSNDQPEIPLEAIVFGRTPAMYMAHCPVGGTGTGQRNVRRPDCTPEQKQYYCRQGSWSLRDRKNAAFPVIPDSRDCSAVLYSHTLTDRSSGVDSIRDRGITRFRICVFSENTEDIPAVVKNILKSINKNQEK